jgi:hypothetical protein
MRYFCLFLFVVISVVIRAQQDSVIVQVQLEDFKSTESIPNATVELIRNGDKSVKRSTQTGKASWRLQIGDFVQLNASHVLYNPKSTSFVVKRKSNSDTLFVRVRLESLQIRTLGDVVIKPPGVPDTVFASETLSVADFELLPTNGMVLLTYPRQLKKGADLIVMNGDEKVYQREVQDTAIELVTDFKGVVHAVCRNKIESLLINENSIEEAVMTPEYFFNYVAPIVDTSSVKWFFSNFNKDYPAFNYFAFDAEDSAYMRVTEIKDELMMELYRSEYKWVDVRTKLWAKNKELETGIDAEVWVGANYFTQSIYYKSLYAPLFERQDTLFVFDYYKDQLRTYNSLGNPIDTLPLFHQYNPKKSGWKNNLIQDKSTGDIYALFERSGYSYLGKIDLTNAQIKETVRLTNRYIDKISIKDEFVYYIYRPFESAQKKYLYKERLPYNLPEQPKETIHE